MSGPVTICVIFYGEHAGLARRFLTELYRCTPPGEFQLRIGLNGACVETVALAEAAGRAHGNVWIHEERRNIFKAPMMAKLFATRPIATGWVIYFDDDSWPYRADWLPALRLKIATEPQVDVWGNPFQTVADEALVRFIRTAVWYRGRPLNHMKPSGERSRRPLLTFVEGGFWAAKVDVVQALGWPDPRLIQNEDDFVFGEALRQHGYRIGRFRSGVRINQAKRRCPPDTPSSYGSD
jgi:hypothetical protein